MVFRKCILFFSMLFFTPVLSFAQNASAVYSTTYPSFFSLKDSIRAMKIPEIRYSDDLNSVLLPSEVDNSAFPFMRPIFLQQDYSCGQAAGVGYAFTYEINRLRNLPSDTSINQYPSHFVWNFNNNGLPETGVSYFDSWDIVKHCGTPNVEAYGGITAECDFWISGYDNYFEGMKNRLYDIYQIKVNTPEGLATAKNWLHNHLSGSDVGGVANCYGSFGWPSALPQGTPMAGKPVIIYSYYPANHAITIVGYNDSIRYDANGDGQYTNHIDITGDGNIDVQDWEIGGFLFANSHGTSYPENGYCYIMYRVFAIEYDNGGIWNHALHIMKAKEENTPQLTMKVVVKHDSRYKIKVTAGISDDLNAPEPQFTMEFPIFNFQGGDHFMQGGNDIEENKTIEAGFDISTLLSYVESGSQYKIFLMVTENDPDNSASGEIVSYSVFDYTNGVEEVICNQSNVPIIQNSSTTLSVTKSLNFLKPEITNTSLPKATVNQSYYQSIFGSGGKPPYRFNLKKNYETESAQGSIPEVNGNHVELNEYGYQVIDLGFEFPFFGHLYDKITIFEDGYLTFSEENYPWPYILPHLNFFQSVANISLFNCRPMYFYPEKGDEIRFYTDDRYAVIVYKASVHGLALTTEINVAARLFSNGRIEIYYGNTTIPSYVSWISGISEGTGEDFFISPFSDTHPVPFAQVQSFTPVVYPDNLSITSNGVITGTPSSECIAQLLIGITDDNNISNTRELTFTTSGLFVKPIVFSGSDEKIDAGDTVKISLELTNLSNSVIGQATVNIEIDNSYIEMIDHQESFGTIGANQTILKTAALRFVVDSLVPNNQMINIEVLLSSTLGQQNLVWQYVASSPQLCLKNHSISEPNDGFLDPGEAAGIMISLNNCGSSSISNVYGELSTTSDFIQILNPVEYFGNILPGNVTEKTFSIQVEDIVPFKHTAQFIFTMWGDGGIMSSDSFNIAVNRLPVLILRLGTNNASALAMKTAMDQLSVGNEIIELSVPESLAWYKSVFISLGHYYANHAITETESYNLENYLGQSGKIYMEGITTWSNDPQTSIHSKFKIAKTSHSWFTIDSLIGATGTAMQNIKLDFVNSNPMANYYIDAVAPAVLYGQSQLNPGLGLGVWYDQGAYQTIGTMVEFGGFSDHEGCTKRDLMEKFLTFFDIPVNPVGINDENLRPSAMAKIFPNPVGKISELMIELPENEVIQVQMFDIQGKSINTPINISARQGVNRIPLDFQQMMGGQYRAGLYVVKLSGKGTNQSVKVLLAE